MSICTCIALSGAYFDGYGLPEEYAERATKINQKYLCITDHGMMSAIPAQIRVCEEFDLHPLFGAELYINRNQPDKKTLDGMSPGDKKNLLDENGLSLRKSYHLLAIAYSNTGYKNLVKLCTWGHVEGFYYRPRINHEQLLKYKEGIIFTSGCYNSEIGQAFECRGEDAAEEVVKAYRKMFGENFYLEIMLLEFAKQRPYNEFLIKMHAKYGIPMILTQDCHFCQQEDSKYQRYMLMIQTETTVEDIKKLSAEDNADIFAMQDPNLWQKSEAEINAFWQLHFTDSIPDDILTQAKLNTVAICKKARGVVIDRSPKLPQIPDAKDKLKELVIQGVKWRGLSGKTYKERLHEEFDLINRKDFTSYFLIKKQLIDEARRVCPQIVPWATEDDALGPGRGSACGSLICYCLGITDVDPIEHGLLFSRFLSESRGGRSIRLPFSGKPLLKS